MLFVFAGLFLLTSILGIIITIKYYYLNIEFQKYSGISDIREELSKLEDEKQSIIESKEEELKRIQIEHDDFLEKNYRIKKEIEILEQELDVQESEYGIIESGFYELNYDFEESKVYQEFLTKIRNTQKNMIKNNVAATCGQEWLIEGSKKKGEKMIKDHIKLVLKAFNGECDTAVLKVNYKNISVMEKRITKSFETLNKLSEGKKISISKEYLNFKIEELRLVHEYNEKKQEEREEQRRIKAEMREEEKARKEIEKAKKDAEKEEQKYLELLEKAKLDAANAQGKKQEKLMDKIEKLQLQLEEANKNKERAMSRAQMTKSGHVYVISNIGSLGKHVYKIGMTRRLEPEDRVHELGNASVPFAFDIHAMIYSENAPELENKLHKIFNKFQVNKVNNRKEFFRIDIKFIEAVVKKINSNAKFTKTLKAEEFRKTLAIIQKQKQLKQAG